MTYAEKKAENIMRDLNLYPRVNFKDDVYKVVRVLASSNKDNGSCCAVVVEDKGVPVGLVTMRGIFEAMEPRAFHISQWSVPVFWEGLWKEQINFLKQVKACDVFVPKEMNGVYADQNLMRVLYSFNKTKTPAVAVIDNNEEMVGVIEGTQVFFEIMQNVAGGDEA